MHTLTCAMDDLLRDSNRVNEALEATDRALSLCEAVRGEAHCETATWLNNTGELLLLAQRYDESCDFFMRARSIFVAYALVNYTFAACITSRIPRIVQVSSSDGAVVDVLLDVCSCCRVKAEKRERPRSTRRTGEHRDRTARRGRQRRNDHDAPAPPLSAACALPRRTERQSARLVDRPCCELASTGAIASVSGYHKCMRLSDSSCTLSRLQKRTQEARHQYEACLVHAEALSTTSMAAVAAVDADAHSTRIMRCIEGVGKCCFLLGDLQVLAVWSLVMCKCN